MSPILGSFAGLAARAYGLTAGIQALPGNYYSIQTYKVSSPVPTITFNSIPQQYRSLIIRGTWQNTTSGNGYGAMTFNGVTTGNQYSGHVMFGNGSSAGSNTADGQSANLFFIGSSAQTVGNMTGGIFEIADYANTSKNKTARGIYGYDTNGGTYTQELGLFSGLWMNNSAINSITLSLTQGTNFGGSSTFSLYGVL